MLKRLTICTCFHDQTDSRRKFNRHDEYVTLRRQVRSASAPPHEAGIQTYSSPQVNSDDSQQTLYNLQPARNVFYEMCFIKSPDLIC